MIISFGLAKQPLSHPEWDREPLPVNAAEWLLGKDTGASSIAILSAAFGYPAHRDYPHDGGDFGCCVRLLDNVPEAALGVERLASICPVWRMIEANWARLRTLHKARAWQTIAHDLRGFVASAAADKTKVTT